MGTEERKSQQLSLEQRYGLGACPALLLLPVGTHCPGGGHSRTSSCQLLAESFTPFPKRCNLQPRHAPAAGQPWSTLRKEARRVRFQVDKAPSKGEGSLQHPRNGQALQPPDRPASESELRELEEKIQEMRDQLRTALVRKSELVAVLGTVKSSRALPTPSATEKPQEER